MLKRFKGFICLLIACSMSMSHLNALTAVGYVEVNDNFYDVNPIADWANKSTPSIDLDWGVNTSSETPIGESSAGVPPIPNGLPFANQTITPQVINTNTYIQGGQIIATCRVSGEVNNILSNYHVILNATSNGKSQYYSLNCQSIDPSKNLSDFAGWFSLEEFLSGEKYEFIVTLRSKSSNVITDRGNATNILIPDTYQQVEVIEKQPIITPSSQSYSINGDKLIVDCALTSPLHSNFKLYVEKENGKVFQVTKSINDTHYRQNFSLSDFGLSRTDKPTLRMYVDYGGVYPNDYTGWSNTKNSNPIYSNNSVEVEYEISNISYKVIKGNTSTLDMFITEFDISNNLPSGYSAYLQVLNSLSRKNLYPISSHTGKHYKQEIMLSAIAPVGGDFSASIIIKSTGGYTKETEYVKIETPSIIINDPALARSLKIDNPKYFMWTTKVDAENANATMRQIVLGDFTDDVTIHGTLAQIAFGLLGVDLPGDIRDLIAELSKDEKDLKKIAINGVGVLPIVGVIKYSDEVGLLVKQGNNIKIIGKQLDKLDDFLINPKKLGEYSPTQLYKYLKDNGYNPKPLSDGSHKNVLFENGGGFKVNWGGDRILQYHPAGVNHHGNIAYWKLSSGLTGIMRFDIKGNLIP